MVAKNGSNAQTQALLEMRTQGLPVILANLPKIGDLGSWAGGLRQ